MQILTRLNAKAGFSDGIGGIPELTTSDIAAALSGCNKPGLDLLLAIVCGGGDSEAIYETFLPEVERLAKREKWRLRPSEEARAHILLQIAVREVIDPNICPSCRGSKYSLMNPSEKCELCEGTGRWLILDQQKAEYIGITPRAYRKTWRDRFESVKTLLELRIYQAKRTIYNNLEG